jgi:hypothetical protein
VCGTSSCYSGKIDGTFLSPCINFFRDTIISAGLHRRPLPLTQSNPDIQIIRHALALDERRHDFHPLILDDDGVSDSLQVWFPGTHSGVWCLTDLHFTKLVANSYADLLHWLYSDVCGGLADHNAPFSLARIPLRWMICECLRLNVGIIFKSEQLRRIGFDMNRLHPLIQPRLPRVMATISKRQLKENSGQNYKMR